MTPRYDADRSFRSLDLSAAGRPLEAASTLPADAFTSADVYALETEQLFEKGWLCAGRADQVPEPGDYRTLDLLGDKLVVVRGADARVRVLSRICRHRAAEIVQGSGNTRSFSCPYHAWTYRLNGELVGSPHMEGVEDFSRADCRLPEIRSELWEGWIFVTFDPDAEPLGPGLAPLSKILSNYRMSDMVAVETATFDSPFNWKVLVDNFMEAYHHIAIHRDTFEPIFPAALSHTPDNEGPYSLLVMPMKSEATGPGKVTPESTDEDAARLDGALPRIGSLSREEEARLVAGVVYPFHLFAPTAESLTWYHIIPERHDRFTLHIYLCFPKQTLEDPVLQPSIDGLKDFVRLVHLQDVEACEAVWAGLSARSFESGRLSKLEKSIWQFNQWWIERMTADLRTR